MALEAKASVGQASYVAADAIVDAATVAAIALALELEGSPEPSRIATTRTTSLWALAGRGRVLRGR